MPEKKRYSCLWRNKWLTSEAKTIDDMIEGLRAAAYDLEKMKDAGIILDPDSGISDDYADLYTFDEAVAKQFDLQHDEYDDVSDEECDDCDDPNNAGNPD